MNSIKKLSLIVSLCAMAPLAMADGENSPRQKHNVKHVIVGATVATGAVAGGVAYTYKHLGSLLKGGVSLLQRYPKQSGIAGLAIAGSLLLANKLKPGWYKPTMNGVSSALEWVGKNTCKALSFVWNGCGFIKHDRF